MGRCAFLAVCAAVPWVLCAASCRWQRGMGAAAAWAERFLVPALLAVAAVLAVAALAASGLAALAGDEDEDGGGE